MDDRYGNGGASTPRMPDYIPPQAGPSRRASLLGLDMGGEDDGMDAATRELIAQLQREDEEERVREEARLNQLRADEELARKEQQSEAQEWQALQEEQEVRNRVQREQYLRDEQRAVSLVLSEMELD